MTPCAQRAPPADTKCPSAAHRKQANALVYLVYTTEILKLAELYDFRQTMRLITFFRLLYRYLAGVYNIDEY